MPISSSPPRYGPHGRDQAITRIRRATRWLAAVATAGTAVLVGVAAASLPGHSAHAAPTPARPGPAGTSAGGVPDGAGPATATGGGSGQISAPPVTPAPSAPAPQVVTGQS